MRIGAMLAEGWWSGLLSFGTIWNHFGDRQSLLAKLVVTYADGSSETIVSNDQWRYFGDGPVRYGSLDMGEVYDASREPLVEGWSTAGVRRSALDTRRRSCRWKARPSSATTSASGAGRSTPIRYDRLSLVGQIGDTAGVYQTLPARSVKEVRPGVFVYDLGQNIVGVPRIRLANGVAGRRITLRYAEMLYPDLPASGGNVGMIMTENYRAAHEPGRLHEPRRRAGDPAAVHLARVPVHRDHRHRSRPAARRPWRAWRSVRCAR